MGLTEKEIDDFINWVVTSDEFYIRQEIRWLVDNIDENSKVVVKRVSKQWEEVHED